MILAMSTLIAQVDPVRLVTPATRASGPWPAGYTMTVWGIAIGVTVLVALVVSTWVRMSGDARALTVQALYWRLSPRQLLLLRSASRASGTPASALLVSRGAFDSAVAAWAGGQAEVSVASRRSLASMAARVFGRPA